MTKATRANIKNIGIKPASRKIQQEIQAFLNCLRSFQITHNEYLDMCPGIFASTSHASSSARQGRLTTVYMVRKI